MDGANLIPDTLIYVKMENQLADKIKSEKVEEEDFDNLQLTEEFDIKSEDDSMPDTSSNRGEEPFIPEANTNFFFCYNCNHASRSKISLRRHINTGKCTAKTKFDKSQSVMSLNVHVCKCNRVFESKFSLDKHLTTCDKKTTRKKTYTYTFNCDYCSKAYKNKLALDNHIIQNHPKFKSTVKRDVYQCSHCSYKSCIRQKFNDHILRHPAVSSSKKLGTCEHCDASFKQEMSLQDHILKKHPEHSASVTGRIHECPHCTYKTTYKSRVRYHMAVHTNTNATNKISKCKHCTAIFQSNNALKVHIIKNHPELRDLIFNRVYKCSHCKYKTDKENLLDKHMSKHSSKDFDLNRPKNTVCKYCKVSYERESWLNEHILRAHPDCTASVSCEILECLDCEYKTTYKYRFAKHMKQHNYRVSENDPYVCVLCKKTFTRKLTLDEHILQIHPNSESLVNSKIHECSYCDFITTMKARLGDHMLKHPHSNKLGTCEHCNATFTREVALHDHILKKHPDVSTSFSSKIYECRQCSYKTTFRYLFNEHMMVHANGGLSVKPRVLCTHCSSSFRLKASRDDHILKKHPDFSSSITRKILSCSYCPTDCPYTTVMKHYLDRHVSVHHGFKNDVK
ncbi:unnamed protein product [Acanthoscelides obtectus]|nr:unnamed protein product [Acanthoscelides obtectus]CAK1676228.1 Zinc finger Y-chromosomal protein [Acanthoscelides obtectus]